MGVTRLRAAVLGALVLAACGGSSSHGTESIELNGVEFRLEVAADPLERARGLSGRMLIAPDGGMLFVFPRSRRLTFEMRDGDSRPFREPK